MSVLQDQVDLLLVPEVAKQPTDVVMLQVSLNLDFAAKLLRDVIVPNLTLVEDLQSDDEFALLLSRQVHVSELAAAQRAPDLEIVDAPRLRIELFGHLVEAGS